MDAAVVLNVLVDLVGDHRDGPVPGNSGQFVEVGRRRDGAGRVLRIVDDDETRAIAQGAADAIPVRLDPRTLDQVRGGALDPFGLDAGDVTGEVSRRLL